jgi:hypothetical protein
MQNELHWFNPIFQEIHYKLAWTGNQDGNCIIYNPEMILKVSPITLNDRIEHLLQTKRFEECLVLIAKQPELNVPIDTILKVENQYMESLIKAKDYSKLKELLPKFVCENRDRWEHFLSRLM